MLRNMPGMAPGAFDYHNVMRFQNGNLQRKALENNRFQP